MSTCFMKKKSNDLYESYNEFGSITLFTPTYNRAYFLVRIYECLLSQTNKHFVWIIVNDGSQDDTGELCCQFVNENRIPILYICKENGGKHSAFKAALAECKTEYFQCMDDDDIYDSKSVDFYLNAWTKIREEQREDIGAIRTIARRTDGTFSVDKLTAITIDGQEDLSTLEMNYVRKIHQENWTCYRTDALRSIDLFPSNYWLAGQHTFFLESIWQGRFARKYLCRYIYTSLREYTDDAEVSLIRSNKTRKHYLNMFINSKMVLDEQLDYICKNPCNLIKSIVLVQLLRGYLKFPLKDLLRNTESTSLKFAYLLSSPIGFFGEQVVTKRSTK